VRGVRSPAFGACLDAVRRLAAVCADGAAALCARADAPDADRLGAFDTCQDGGLAAYHAAVTGYNDLCGRLGFQARPASDRLDF
jgi:hypothetical protein